MTTITIERALLERVRNALESSSPIKLTQASITEHEFVIRILRSALAAPATAPEQPSWQDAIASAIPAMREYARKNPKHHFGPSLQDPSGVHAWLAKHDHEWKDKP